MTADFDWIQESKGWKDRHPLGPVHFDLLFDGVPVVFDVPANKLDNGRRKLAELAEEIVSKLRARLRSLENRNGAGI